MKGGLTEEDAKKIAAAFREALKADASTTESAKHSVRKILEDAGAIALGQKIAETDASTWASIWISIKEFFVEIWEGIVGAVEALMETIDDWLQ